MTEIVVFSVRKRRSRQEIKRLMAEFETSQKEQTQDPVAFSKSESTKEQHSASDV
jgi:hypothetical protein